MLSLYGAGIGKGIAIGRAFILNRADIEIPQYSLQEDEVDDDRQV